MGKCKVCGAHIDDGETLCEDCKALSETDVIKSEEELNQLLDSVQNTDIELHNNIDDETIPNEDFLRVDPIQIDEVNENQEEIIGELDDITSSLLEEYTEDSKTSEPILEDEPFSIDSLQEAEEPFSIDSLQEAEESFSTDSLQEEEPFSIDSLQNEAESTAQEQKAEPLKDDNEQIEVDLSAYDDIFEGVDDIELDNDNKSDLGDIISDVLGNISNKGIDKEEQKQKEKEPKEKVGFFKSLFSNVEDEHAEENLKKEQEEEEQRKEKKAAKEEARLAAKASKKAAAAEKKKQKENLLAEKRAQRAKEAEEEEKDTTKINTKGAVVVFILFALVGTGIIALTNIFQYSSSVSKAKDNFSKKRYEEAYDMISGLDLKDADKKIEKKIKTVMYVNKELVSYQNYYTIQYYAEALNSLLNGLTKYNVYLEQAGKLGVKTDLEYVKSQILKELDDKYNMTEEQANKILEISDRVEYSDKVIAIAKTVAEKQQ